MATLPPNFLSFLRAAKFATYAAQGDQATVRPVFAGSKQLEFSQGQWLYRDIYFGMLRFTGQEVVYFNGQAIWSMAYSGGLLAGVASSEARSIYKALRAALSVAPVELPLRGPAKFEFESTHYTCMAVGDIVAFHGEEQLSRGEHRLYELRFAGGALA